MHPPQLSSSVWVLIHFQSQHRPISRDSNPVNLNSASITQLQTLPGVGASTAQRILDYRQKNGGFKKIEELMNVKGIGEKSFLKLKPLITVGDAKPATRQ